MKIILTLIYCFVCISCNSEKLNKEEVKKTNSEEIKVLTFWEIIEKSKSNNVAEQIDKIGQELEKYEIKDIVDFERQLRINLIKANQVFGSSPSQYSESSEVEGTDGALNVHIALILKGKDHFKRSLNERLKVNENSIKLTDPDLLRLLDIATIIFSSKTNQKLSGANESFPKAICIAEGYLLNNERPPRTQDRVVPHPLIPDNDKKKKKSKN